MLLDVLIWLTLLRLDVDNVHNWWKINWIKRITEWTHHWKLHHWNLPSTGSKRVFLQFGTPLLFPCTKIANVNINEIQNYYNLLQTSQKCHPKKNPTNSTGKHSPPFSILILKKLTNNKNNKDGLLGINSYTGVIILPV